MTRAILWEAPRSLARARSSSILQAKPKVVELQAAQPIRMRKTPCNWRAQRQCLPLCQRQQKVIVWTWSLWQTGLRAWLWMQLCPP